MSNRYRGSDRKIDLDFKSWCENAIAGSCHLCTQLFYAVAGPDYRKVIDKFDAAIYQLGFTVGAGNSGKYVKFIDASGSRNKYLAIAETLSLNSKQVQQRQQLANNVGAFTVTPHTVRQISQWMGKCSNEHECQQDQQLASVHLPLRLIDVDPSGEYLSENLWEPNFDGLCCEKATRVCIKHSKDALTTNSTGVKYLTLSHRWGGTVPTALTWENMEDDRLPAISGIARWFMARLGLSSQSYLAGLWRETLPGSLLWHLYDLHKGEAARDLNAAPSWSWASVLAPSNLMVIGQNDYISLRPLFQDIQTMIVPKNEDRFGQLDVAILRLQASVIPIEREFRNGALQIRLPGEGRWYKEWHTSNPVPVTTFWEKLERDLPPLCRRLGLMSFEQLLALLRKTTTQSYVQMRWDTTDMLWATEEHPPSQLYMVPIAWDLDKKCLTDIAPGNLVIQGLILRRLSGKGQYERVGMFMTSQYRHHYRNADFAQAIIRCMPNKAVDSLSDGAFKQLGNEWLFGISSFFGLLKSRHGQEDFQTVANLLSPEDHMGVSSDGMSLIEIL
ncbi:het domain containing protein [Colletotrichum asianum]|uniref:Het domain containing protein n=1 Tax=Colletotrichum asianum TaxID=702518 RepID=A0A8H3ZIL3_9PEZI|nr:het domain containing protein [Colletotrichum asianum]